MGYLYLTAALFAGIAKGFCGKTVSRDMQNFKECTFINLMRMFFCALVGFILAAVKLDVSSFTMSVKAFEIYLLASVSMSVFCITWMYAYRNEAYMFLSIFTMLGTIVTCLLDRVFYHAPIRGLQWLGMAVLLCAVYIMSVYNKGVKGKLTAKGLFILILGSIGSSVADFSQKIYIREIGTEAGIFNFYMYAFSFLLLVPVFLLCTLNKNTPKTGQKLYDKRHMGIYFAMAFFLYLNSTTKTMAASFLSSAQIYPVLQGANLILSALMAHFLFKEKMNMKSLFGILTAFAGLLIIH